MNPDKPFTKGPLVWILAAGVLVGAGATASVMSAKNGSGKIAVQSPSVSVSSQPIGQLRTESLDMVKALDESFANLADAVKPAVVHIRVRNEASRNATGERMAAGGEGSGFIFRPDGYIITNDHVAGGFEKVNVILYDGREFPGKVLRAWDSDIAVIKIEANNLPSLPFADSEKVRAGEFAVAVGAPFGLENTVTVGHVSATQRENQIPDPTTGKYRVYSDLIQTDAAINMGNSGGPLLNIEGQVIGVNSAIFSPTGTSGGIGFAISSNQARLLAETLVEKGKVSRGFLGILPSNLKIAQAKNLGVEKGAYVSELPSDGPAAMAGIKKGDVVVRINNMPINSQVDLRNSMIKFGPGSKVEVEVVRDRQSKTFSVTAKEPPVQESMLRQQLPNREPQVDIDDFPGFKDFPRTQDPNQMPNRTGSARLGVEVGDVNETARKTYGIDQSTRGAVVNSIAPNSVAARNGLQVGDVVTEIDGQKVSDAASLADAMKKVKWGETKKVKITRFDKGSRLDLDREVTFR